MANITKKEKLIAEAQKIISSYSIKFTLRQLYYQLVAKMIIPNNLNEYKYLSSVLVEARKSGKMDFDDIEDRTRSISNNSKIYYHNPDVQFKSQLDELIESQYEIARNIYQPKLVVIALEKQALQSIFEDAIPYESTAILIVCRGFNSLTQLHNLVELLKNDPRECHCRFFSDYDPSGLDIQRNFETQCAELGLKFTSFERVALTKEQIDHYALPSAPVKASDSRSKSWGDSNVVELDALNPLILKSMIEKTVTEFWDFNIAKEVQHLGVVLQRRYQRRMERLNQFLEGF